MWQRFRTRRTLILFSGLTIALLSIATPSSLGQAKMPGAPALPKCADLEQVRQTLKKLSTENERLTKKIADLERRLIPESVRNRLTQEEQRAENLQSQLRG